MFTQQPSALGSSRSDPSEERDGSEAVGDGGRRRHSNTKRHGRFCRFSLRFLMLSITLVGVFFAGRVSNKSRIERLEQREFESRARAELAVRRYQELLEKKLSHLIKDESLRPIEDRGKQEAGGGLERLLEELDELGIGHLIQVIDEPEDTGERPASLE